MEKTGAKSPNQQFCPTCGEYVDLYQAKVQDKMEHRCVYCGQVLDRTEVNLAHLQGSILTAEDSPLLRQMLKDVLLERNITQEVKTCQNGQEMVTLYTQMLLEKKIPGAIILDVIMPVMNGYFTAIALRGVEKAFPKQKPVPIIFLSAKDLDKDFQNVIKFCQPCHYLSKGENSEAPEKIGEKIESIIKEIKSKK